MAALVLNLLGGFELRPRGGPPIDLSTKTGQALLAYLALTQGQRHSRDKLAALLWEDRPDQQARTSLRQTLAVMRKTLQPFDGTWLDADGDWMAIDRDGFEIDVVEFERLAGLATAESLMQAAVLYKGELLQGFNLRSESFAEWLRTERERLRGRALHVLARLLALQSEGRDIEAAIATANRLLSLDPLNEGAHRSLMRLYVAGGRQELALRQYDICRDRLRRELNVGPDPETATLHQEILARRSATDSANAAAPSSPAPKVTISAVPDTDRPDRPSIAVLPFTNMSGDPEQEYFSDGITDDIITELSRFRGLFVIARNSSFAFKETAVDVRSIGQQLGVRYVVEGSVRRAGNRIRVTAQLIDAVAGNHLWAERYDRELAGIFEVQDEVSRAIVTNIAPRLQSEDQYSAKRRAPEDMRAYDHYLRAKLLIDTPADLSDLKRGREHCDRAIEIDPGYARAFSYKALSYTNGLAFMEANDPEAWVKQALASAEQAVALDDLDNVSHWAIGVAALRAQEPDRARRHIRKALAINPNDADVLAEASYIEVALGDPEAGLRNIAMAVERNPMNPPWYHWVMGAAMELLGRYEDALVEYDQYGAPNPAILKLRAMALAGLGRMDEAHAQVQALLAVRPGLTVATLRKSEACFPGNDARMERLRLAGLPE